jgi:hypothetical protein
MIQTSADSTESNVPSRAHSAFQKSQAFDLRKSVKLKDKIAVAAVVMCVFVHLTVFGQNLAGNAQGGAITNLDHSILNLGDYGGNLAGIFAQATNGVGTTIYVPSDFWTTHVTMPFNVYPGFGSQDIFTSPIHVNGNGPYLSVLDWWGTNGIMFDSSHGNFGSPSIDFNGVLLRQGYYAAGTNFGYVTAPGASGTLNWINDEIDDFDIGACVTTSGDHIQPLALISDNVGFILGPYSDVSDVDISPAFGCTNAAMETDSRGNRIFLNTSDNNMGILVGAGGDESIQISAEYETNCDIAIGYPPSWPFATVNTAPLTTQYAGTQMGNGVAVGHIDAGNGYIYALNTTNAAYMKIWNAPRGVHIHNVSDTGGRGVVSFTNTADVVPYTFDDVSGMTPLVTFSDSTTVPAADNQHVGVNVADYEYTKNSLKYSRDTNGDVFVGGGFSTAQSNGDAPISISVGASPFTCVNTTGYDVEIYIDGGTVSAIKKNGTQIFSSTGKTFHVQPNETFEIVYSAAPTATYSPF